MIELLLQAERALGTGALDVAERLYWQAIDADSQNAIAIVGLAKVARQRGDDRTAIAFGRRALKVDSENAVARRLVGELEAAHPEEARATVAAGGAGAPTEAGGAAGTAAAADPDDAPLASAPEAAAPTADVTQPAAGSGSASEADPPPKRAGRTDVEWPAADLQQIRPPRDR